jgi:protein TonB
MCGIGLREKEPASSWRQHDDIATAFRLIQKENRTTRTRLKPRWLWSGLSASRLVRQMKIERFSMSETVIFKDLPATFPERDKYRKPSVVGSVILHGFLIAAVLVVPLLIPQTLSDRELLITLLSPIAPPPPPPPPPSQPPAAAAPRVVKIQIRRVSPEAVIMPTVIPKEIAKIIDQPAPSVTGVIGGVPGGIPGGAAAGVLGGILAANANVTPAVAPPPPPPPPPPPQVIAPAEPVRVGGLVREPRPIKVVPPVYPALASRAHVSGTVILEATLTTGGTVSEIRVISGHPLLVQAAIDCVKQWQYEPTFLNGVPVSVILTARVSFSQPHLP